MKTKNSSRSPRNRTPGDIRYLNYYLEFPDGTVWSDYSHIAGGLESWITRTRLYKDNPDAARALVQKGEYHFYLSHGTMGRVRHHMVISDTKCEQNWGTGKVKTKSAIEVVR